MPDSVNGYKTIAIALATIGIAIAGHYGIVVSLGDSVTVTMVVMGLVMWLMRLASKSPAGKVDNTQAILRDLLAALAADGITPPVIDTSAPAEEPPAADPPTAIAAKPAKPKAAAPPG